ncbi:hypothetical protein FIU82_00145 [Pseudoalteromonas sp. THAF3]|uniref:DUF494 family protein n=1 Tax=Pseudoalteromonas TaxID=53246 RepID=UPI00034D62AC|nr:MULTISPECIES: DUF494 family protein [Pseudoalteromonas]MCF2863814.1 DUF494 family protein [Pseudoalteromonas sp. CNAT2-18]MCG7559436.1 DUF494 family protein [Pseudoalteromonas sp. CNAT2-18.1]QFU03443.1 hypothetical protein FIU82_00145 [Pseudoalteromonas sp. THAF3]|tara:strand:+ start:7790 stop:8263 length:474 start_codon:yes stop_codon:yes gene_type:complete
MFDILMYLFENYIHSESEIFVEENVLTDELRKAGFNNSEIFKALDWLEQLAQLQYSDERPYLHNAPTGACRIYTEYESMKLDTQCQGFLMFLEQIGVIDSTTREMVIDRAVALDQEQIALDDLKWVVLMVLLSVPGQEQAYAQMEDLIFDDPNPTLH